MNELVRNVLRRYWFTTSFDGIDIVLYALLQLFPGPRTLPVEDLLDPEG